MTMRYAQPAPGHVAHQMNRTAAAAVEVDAVWQSGRHASTIRAPSDAYVHTSTEGRQDAKDELRGAACTAQPTDAGTVVALTLAADDAHRRSWFVPRGSIIRQTVIVVLAVLAFANGCATCSLDDLADRASWGAPVAIVDQAWFVYRGDVVPSVPWGIPVVRTWGVPCRLPKSARNTVRPCTPAEMADPNGPVCYIWRYVR